MRVAMVSREFPPTRQASGIATYTQKTSAALAAKGHEVHVFSEAHRGAPVDEVRDGVVVHRLRDPLMKPREARYLRRSFDVARALRTHGPFDVVQACEWEGEAAIYARFPQAPLITRLATPLYIVESLNRTSARERRRSRIVRFLERAQTRLSHTVISPSRSLATTVTRDWKLGSDRVHIVPTGIELPPPGSDGPLPTGLGVDPYVLYFGRLEVRKGVLTWMDALPQVLRAHPALDAVFVGDDLKLDGLPFSDYGRSRCGELADRLRFLRRLPQESLFPIIRQAQLVVLPSRWESIANAGLEAMALGVPVVATLGSGFAELIEDGKTGWLVPPDDAQALARTVSAALDDPATLRAVGQAARRRAQDYGLDRMVGRLVEVYERVAGAASGRYPEVSVT